MTNFDNGLILGLTMPWWGSAVEKEPPTLVVGSRYAGLPLGDEIDRMNITKVTFVDSYTPTGTETASYIYDVNGAGDITGYLLGTELVIAGNGSGRIMANSNSSSMFHNWTSLTSIEGISLLDTSNATTMSFMFSGCTSLSELDLSTFNTSSVTTMKNMFDFCRKLTSLNISSFDTSNVINMSNMFDECLLLSQLDVRNFDTSKVTDMSHMFCMYGTESTSGGGSITTLDLTSFDTRNVTNFRCMFWYNKSLRSVLVGDNWIVNEAAKTSDMFSNCGVSSVTYV